MSRRILISALLLTAWISSGAGLENLTWENPDAGEFFTRDGHPFFRLTIPEAEKNGQHCAATEFDFTPYRSNLVRFSIRVSGRDVSVPPQPWNGVKFMLNYGAEKDRWTGSNSLAGTFPIQETSFLAAIESDAGPGRIMIGLQDSSGTVEFDLGSLKIEPLFESAPKTVRRIEYPEAVRNTPPLRGVMSPKRFKPEDFPVLKEWNVNLVRFQISRNFLKAGSDRDLAEYDRWIDDTLDHLEWVLAEGRKYGIRFVIDLHQPPGGRLPNRELTMYYDEVYANHFIRVWEKIAARFKGNLSVWAYDLVNEPEQLGRAKFDYLTIQKMAAEAVRKIDPDTPIMIEANRAATPAAFHYLVPLEMDNVIYQVHMYLPGAFTHQNVFLKRETTPPVAYPGMISGRIWNKDELKKALAPVREFQLRHHARIYVGEFSAIAWAPGAARYLEDCIAIFEEYGWDWTYHAFREYDGWSLEHEGTYGNLKPAESDTPRKKVLLDAFKKNHRETK